MLGVLGNNEKYLGFRMYPVVIGNGRQLTKDTVICGYNIPKGVRIIVQLSLVLWNKHYNSDLT